MALHGAPLLFPELVIASWTEDFVYVGTDTIALLAVHATSASAVDFAAGVLGAKRLGGIARGHGRLDR